MGNQIIKILLVIVSGFVAWVISDAAFNAIYISIDNAILSSGESVSWLLKVMKVVVGLLAYDGVSFACVVLIAILSLFKLSKARD